MPEQVALRRAVLNLSYAPPILCDLRMHGQPRKSKQMFTQRVTIPARIAAALVACMSFVSTGFSDPLHKFRMQDAFWHHGSGWVYPRQVGALELIGSPAQIDGNDDVTAEYATKTRDARRTAIVDIYYPTSAATGAKLSTAKAALHAEINVGGCATSESEGGFALQDHPEIVGVKVALTPAQATSCSQAAIYFFRSANWIIAIRTTAAAADAGASAALDEFVRALRWDTLDTDPQLRDVAP